MNKARRTAIAALAAQVEELVGKINDLKSEFETQRDEEQEYYDNMPESFQSGDKGQQAESAIEALGNICEALDMAESSLDEISGYSDEACA